MLLPTARPEQHAATPCPRSTPPASDRAAAPTASSASTATLPPRASSTGRRARTDLGPPSRRLPDPPSRTTSPTLPIGIQERMVLVGICLLVRHRPVAFLTEIDPCRPYKQVTGQFAQGQFAHGQFAQKNEIEKT